MSHINEGIGNSLRARTVYSSSSIALQEPAHPLDRDQQRHSAEFKRKQKEWSEIQAELPPRLSRRHIMMISTASVIGVGLFLQTGEGLRHGGPGGLLIGYAFVGSIVYCVVTCVGQMVAYTPNVGGVVGMADLYVDPALGFAMGWMAWYHWAIVQVVEITAAVTLMHYYVQDTRFNPLWVTIFLSVAVGINCFGTRTYGNIEFWFASTKVFTIVFLLFLSVALVLGAGAGGPIGFRNWLGSGVFAQYLDIPGPKGRFLGFWSVLMQAAFSYFGSEVPAVAAAEVINASKNIPAASRRVWARIVLFYILSVVAAGFLVAHDDPRLNPVDSPGGDAMSSPFVIAVQNAKIKYLPSIINAAFLLSAWSAAAADVYISSRYMYFLAKRSHAPKIFAVLYLRNPPTYQSPEVDNIHQYEFQDKHSILVTSPTSATDLLQPTLSARRSSFDQASPMETAEPVSRPSIKRSEPDPRDRAAPWGGISVATLVGLLGFMASSDASRAFQWFANMTSAASLQSWMCMMITYIRWHQGIQHAKKKERFLPDLEHLPPRPFQEKKPYLAYYALITCSLIIMFNGWAVFTQPWPIATDYSTCSGADPSKHRYLETSPVITTFVTSYLPMPIFLLLVFAYKLIKQTKHVPLDSMTFSRDGLPQQDVQEEDETKYSRGWWFGLIAG